MADRDSIDRSSSDTGRPLVLQNESQIDDVLPRSSVDGHKVPKSASEKANESSAAFDNVVQSDIGVNTLLTRLKQSISSARDFAVFLKKRSSIEEEHAQGLKKLCRSSNESSHRPDSRQGSYARNLEEICRIHDRMADNGVQFALSLHQMHEDLQELAAEKERGRKQWKQTGLSAEKRVQDSESAMEKARTKYNSLAEDYDRARTGDKQSGRFGLKGPKSAAQVEEDLNRKMQAADSDYSSKVQSAQALRRDLLSTSRPQTTQALQQLISECDSGLSLQMQKFASFNEKLLLSNGLCVSPLKSQNSSQSPSGRSLRDVVYGIDNDRDLKNFVASFASKVGPRHQELKYERHQSLQPTQQIPPQVGLRQAQQTQGLQVQPSQSGPAMVVQGNPYQTANQAPSSANLYPQGATIPYNGYSGSPKQQLPSATNQSIQTQSQPPQASHPPAPQVWLPSLPNQNAQYGTDLPPLSPVFGVSLEDLFSRDGSAVPMVVYQCLQAVDLFGLEVEGIYRLSGTGSHVAKLRLIFDNDAAQVDFRNPESFFHDVNSVAGLLKQFFRDLPDPLLTREHYQGFIEAALSNVGIDDDITRRDSLHATINSLPDPNYATLRALALHLHRVQEHSSVNRMNAGNLAICFGPTLMGSNSGPNIADAGWQVRVIDTILQNTYQIFDDD